MKGHATYINHIVWCHSIRQLRGMRRTWYFVGFSHDVVLIHEMASHLRFLICVAITHRLHYVTPLLHLKTDVGKASLDNRRREKKGVSKSQRRHAVHQKKNQEDQTLLRRAAGHINMFIVNKLTCFAYYKVQYIRFKMYKKKTITVLNRPDNLFQILKLSYRFRIMILQHRRNCLYPKKSRISLRRNNLGINLPTAHMTYYYSL